MQVCIGCIGTLPGFRWRILNAHLYDPCVTPWFVLLYASVDFHYMPGSLFPSIGPAASFLVGSAALVAGEPEVVDARRDLAGVRLPIAVGIAERDVGERMDHHLPDRLAVRGVDGPGLLDGNRVGGLPKTGPASPLSMNQ